MPLYNKSLQTPDLEVNATSHGNLYPSDHTSCLCIQDLSLHQINTPLCFLTVLYYILELTLKPDDSKLQKVLIFIQNWGLPWTKIYKMSPEQPETFIGFPCLLPKSYPHFSLSLSVLLPSTYQLISFIELDLQWWTSLLSFPLCFRSIGNSRRLDKWIRYVLPSFICKLATSMP